MITLENAVDILMQDDTFHYTKMYSHKGNYWVRLSRDITIQLSTGNIITIPKGYEYDGKSSPASLWGILPPIGDFDLAVLIHDYLYTERPFGITQKQADKEMLIWSKAINGNLKWDSWYYQYPKKRIENWLSYWGVRIVGWLVWKKIIKLSKGSKI